MVQQITMTAGTDIKIGQFVCAEMTDEDTSEPLTLVYPLVEGKQPIGIAMSNAQRWQDVVIAVEGRIGSQETYTAIAGEKLQSGDAVYLGADGKLRKSSQSEIRWGIAGADLKKGQALYFDPVIKAYIPTPDGYPTTGKAMEDALKGRIFAIILSPDQ